MAVNFIPPHLRGMIEKRSKTSSGNEDTAQSPSKGVDAVTSLEVTVDVGDVFGDRPLSKADRQKRNRALLNERWPMERFLEIAKAQEFERLYTLPNTSIAMYSSGVGGRKYPKDCTSEWFNKQEQTPNTASRTNDLLDFRPASKDTRDLPLDTGSYLPQALPTSTVNTQHPPIGTWSEQLAAAFLPESASSNKLTKSSESLPQANIDSKANKPTMANKLSSGGLGDPHPFEYNTLIDTHYPLEHLTPAKVNSSRSGIKIDNNKKTSMEATSMEAKSIDTSSTEAPSVAELLRHEWQADITAPRKYVTAHRSQAIQEWVMQTRHSTDNNDCEIEGASRWPTNTNEVRGEAPIVGKNATKIYQQTITGISASASVPTRNDDTVPSIPSSGGQTRVPVANPPSNHNSNNVSTMSVPQKPASEEDPLSITAWIKDRNRARRPQMQHDLTPTNTSTPPTLQVPTLNQLAIERTTKTPTGKENLAKQEDLLSFDDPITTTTSKYSNLTDNGTHLTAKSSTEEKVVPRVILPPTAAAKPVDMDIQSSVLLDLDSNADNVTHKKKAIEVTSFLTPVSGHLKDLEELKDLSGTGDKDVFNDNNGKVGLTAKVADANKKLNSDSNVNLLATDLDVLSVDSTKHNLQ